jgi:hypothetical protein
LAGATILPAVVVQVKDQFGNLVTNNQSAVTLAIASGGGAGVTLGGTVTKAASGGVATFNNLSIAAAGTYTLVATDGVLGSATSSSFIITAPALPATHLAISTQPSNAVAGTTISPAVKVEVRDANGHVVLGNQSSVTLAIASGPSGAVLSGTLTVPVVNGIATFSNLSLLTAGTYTLRAVDGALASATSSSFIITAPALPATHLVFSTQPSNAVAGATISPAVRVEVRDANGQVVVGNQSSVTLAIASGPSGAVLGGMVPLSPVAPKGSRCSGCSSVAAASTNPLAPIATLVSARRCQPAAVNTSNRSPACCCGCGSRLTR